MRLLTFEPRQMQELLQKNNPICSCNYLKNLDLLIVGKKTSKLSSTIVKIVDNELTLIRQGKLILKDYVNQ